MPIHVTTSTTQSLSNKTFVDRVSTTGVVYASSGNSNQWSSAYSSFNAASGKYDLTYTTVSSNSAYWDSTYNTVYTASGAWRQTLSFDENTALLSILSGNTVSLSALSSVGGGGGISTETDPKFTTWAQANSAKYESTYTTVSAITGNLILGQLGLAINGNGSVITTGTKQYLRVPYNCIITSYEVVIDPPGAIEMGIYKSTFETFPPTTSIKSIAGPAASLGAGDGGIRRRGTNLASENWTTALTAGEYLRFDVTLVENATAAALTLTTLR
jgi:hypothetical protein